MFSKNQTESLRGTRISLRERKFEKQSFSGVLQNRCSCKFRKFYRKTPLLESFFNKDPMRMIVSCEIGENFKSACFCRTPPVAAPVAASEVQEIKFSTVSMRSSVFL